MAKLKKSKIHSLKWTFLIYIPVCVILSVAGSFAIGSATNYLQQWYEEEVFDVYTTYHQGDSVMVIDSDGTVHYEPYVKPSYEKGTMGHQIAYFIISWAQAVLIPLWVLFCVGLTGTVFYKRELEKPLKVLKEASNKIAENCLEFEMPKVRNNELGDLCESFGQMKSALYENNKKTWRLLEERKQLNATFAHDIRTPITVLKGYTDLLKKYEGTDNLTAEKKTEILELMGQQVERLENYAQNMSTVQKLEDIELHKKNIPIQSIIEKCREMCRIIVPKEKENLTICFKEKVSGEAVFVDEELLIEVFENLLNNALRYAIKNIEVNLCMEKERLQISVEDDGKGFTREELENATRPFYRAGREKEENHFGLGLFICNIICQKSGGSLQLENGKNGGGKVTAVFFTK